MAQQIVPQRLYYRVFATLLAFTLLTWGVSYLDLGGRLHLVVAITIAVCKATLVVLFFMHVFYSSRLIWVLVGAGIFWLTLLLAFTMGDYASRAWLPQPVGWQHGATNHPAKPSSSFKGDAKRISRSAP
jgi:cytochrome c oxidase subunit 4